MALTDNYTITNSIKEDNHFVFRNAVRKKDRCSCILKSTLQSNASLVKQLENEFEIASHLDAGWAVLPISLERSHDESSLAYEDFNLEFLDELIEDTGIEINIFLPIAVNITAALAEMHKKEIVHRDIKPSNILVDPQTHEIKFFNFQIASVLSAGNLQTISNTEVIEGSLAYMSPEQTGRMNRSVDFRTDLYSLGVTFYQMLTGKLPFNAMDPLEWIYCHMAKTPGAPDTQDAEIPKMISSIVMKLISKLAEDRYQSAMGLLHDLKKCIDQLETTKKIEPFTLGEKDFSGLLQLSQKIYGREEEIALLLNTYKNLIENGTPKLILVSGYSGIGKTSLVNELHKPIVHEKGFFISGKFDQYKRDIPYSTIVEAFKGLVRLILLEKQEKINEWKEKILNAVGINGQVIVDVIPQVELIIGKQPRVAELPQYESQNRFNNVFEKFITVFSNKNHPLTIFLDDLQWADAASLKLIQHILTNLGNNFFLIIGAYRDNEVSFIHPLMLTLEEIKKANKGVLNIKLAPLNEQHITNLLEDTLQADAQYIQTLASLVFEKTGGNPFFVIQFITELYQEKLLRYNHDSFKWEWSVPAIKSKGYTDNVVDLMAGKLKRIDQSTQDILKLAACVGSKFDSKTLSIIATKSEHDLTAELKQATHEGLIIHLHDCYKFLHDRVQQAAYNLIHETQLGKIHLTIGRLLLADTPAEKIEESVFNIVSQFSLGDTTLLDANEKIKLAGLNLLAAKKAKSSVAYSSAVKFLAAGIRLLSEQSWKDNYELTFNLYYEKAECNYLDGNIKDAETILDFILEKAVTRVDKAAVYRTKIKLSVTKGEIAETVRIALDGLEKLFGISISPHPPAEEVVKECEKVNKNTTRCKIEELVCLPLMTDPDMKAAMSIFSELYAAAFYTDQNLYVLHLSHMINLSVQHGNTDASVLAYGAYGLSQIIAFDKYEEGYQFAALGLNLVKKHGFLSFNSKALFHLALASYWHQHVNVSIGLLKQGFQAGVDMGDIPMACYNSAVLINHYLVQGSYLNEVLRESENYLAFNRKAKFIDTEKLIIAQQQFIACMQARTDSFSTFNGESFNEAQFEESLRLHIPTTRCWYYTFKMRARFSSGNYQAVVDTASAIRDFLPYIKVSCLFSDYHFFHSLALAALYTSATAEEKNTYLQIIKESQGLFEKWKNRCAENFTDKYVLLSAELCRITGEDQQAMRLYEQCIESAHANNFIHIEATGYELAAKFYRERGFILISNTYLKEAMDRYTRWGAAGKVKYLEEQYPFLIDQKITLSASTLEGLPATHFDNLSIIKASQIISGQIELEELNEALMKIVIEQSGAQKALLLLEQDNNFKIVCEANTFSSETIIKTFHAAQVYTSDIVPESIINYVARTKEKIILDDASRTNLFDGDAYIATNLPKSLACVPIIKQTTLSGILYLENNLLPGAFTADKISILEVLASQISILIENAVLFKELTTSKHQLQNVIDNSSAIIYVKNLDGRYLFINGEYEKRFKISREKAVGKTAYDFWPKEIADMGAAHDRQVIEAGHSISFEETAPHEDGPRTYVTLRFPLYDNSNTIYALCCIATDITDRKHMEEALRQEEERSRYLAQATRDAIYDWDITNDTVWRNEAYQQLYSPETPVGKDKNWWENHIHIYDRQRIIQSIQHAFSQKLDSWSGEYKFLRFDGDYANVIDRGYILYNDSGNPVRMIGAITDITEGKRAEEALRDLSAHLQEVREEERINIAREIHDELGQQLTGIKMDVTWLSKKVPLHEETLKQKLHDVLRMLDGAVKTIRRISTELRPSVLDDLGLVAAMEWQSQEFETRSGIVTEFESQISDISVPPNIATGLFRIYQESLTNVARHAHARKVSSSIRLNENKIILKVSDNGKGFEVNKIGNKKTLGLLGMKERTVMMDGACEITSEPGKGTTVHVEVPL